MKKWLSFLSLVLIMFIMTIPVFADAGPPGTDHSFLLSFESYEEADVMGAVLFCEGVDLVSYTIQPSFSGIQIYEDGAIPMEIDFMIIISETELVEKSYIENNYSGMVIFRKADFKSLQWFNHPSVLGIA